MGFLLVSLPWTNPTTHVSPAYRSPQFHFDEVERNAPCKVNIHPPDYEKKSTAHYRERLYKEVTKIRNEDKKREDQVLQENRTQPGGLPRRR